MKKRHKMITPLYENRFFDGVNFDYILALRYDENAIEKKEIPIHKDKWLIEDIYSMVDDDRYEVDDIYNAFKSRYKDHGEFDYCLGHNSLHNFYINAISYPNLDVIKYRQQAKFYKDRIESARNESAREWHQKTFNKWNFKQKKDYINHCLPYIFASNYHNAIVENQIENDYFIYSNETHGRFSYAKKITEDIDIEIKTNFCYGDSSSLVVIISYKGIPIIPYSIWVRYYYAGFNEIINCTRNYRPERRNWDNCMDFVVWFVNKALENPEGFVKETILDEVKTLMDGLEEVLHISDEKMKKYMEFDNKDKVLQDKYYIGIRSGREANSDEIKRYSIAPEEVKFVFRMEKITGALRFIKSLKELREIDCDFEKIINRIKEMNELIYPELINAIPPVREYVSELQTNLTALEKRFNIVKRRYESYEDRLNKKLEKYIGTEERKKAEESFIKLNPQYIKYNNEYIDLLVQMGELKERIKKRESYLRKLEVAKSLVLKHTGVAFKSIEQKSETNTNDC